MKPYNIDVERLDGMVMRGAFIELQGSMDVRVETQPLEGVHQSSLHMSIETARVLHVWLSRALARTEGLRGPAP
jgi:hypothetical protein